MCVIYIYSKNTWNPTFKGDMTFSISVEVLKHPLILVASLHKVSKDGGYHTIIKKTRLPSTHRRSDIQGDNKITKHNFKRGELWIIVVYIFLIQICFKSKIKNEYKAW